MEEKFLVYAPRRAGKNSGLYKNLVEEALSNYESEYEKFLHDRDFYGLDGTITCGKCGKKLGWFRSLFHFHSKVWREK